MIGILFLSQSGVKVQIGHTYIILSTFSMMLNKSSDCDVHL